MNARGTTINIPLSNGNKIVSVLLMHRWQSRPPEVGSEIPKYIFVFDPYSCIT